MEEEGPAAGGGPCRATGGNNLDKAGPCPLGDAALTDEEEGVEAAESGSTSIPSVVRIFF